MKHIDYHEKFKAESNDDIMKLWEDEHAQIAMLAGKVMGQWKTPNKKLAEYRVREIIARAFYAGRACQ